MDECLRDYQDDTSFQQSTKKSASVFKNSQSIRPKMQLLSSLTFEDSKNNTLSVFETNSFQKNHPQHHPQKQCDNLPYLSSCKSTEDFLEVRNNNKIQNDDTILDCKTILRNSDILMEGSEMVRKEAERYVQRANVSMEKKGNDISKGIEYSSNKNERWKKELENEMKETTSSIVALEDFKIKMESALKKCEEVMVVVLRCIEREKKPLDVHSCLMQEEKTLRQLAGSLRVQINDINNNITGSKHTRQDLSDAVMRMFQATKSNTPWSNEASSLVELSQKQRYANQSQIDSICEFFYSQSQVFSKQWKFTNQQLSFKLHDFAVSESKLQEHLKKVLIESKEVERMREKVESFMAKENIKKEFFETKTETLMKGGILGMEDYNLEEKAFRDINRLKIDMTELGDNADQTHLKLRKIECTSVALLRLQKSLSHNITSHKNLSYSSREILGDRRAFEVTGDFLCLK